VSPNDNPVTICLLRMCACQPWHTPMGVITRWRDTNNHRTSSTRPINHSEQHNRQSTGLAHTHPCLHSTTSPYAHSTMLANHPPVRKPFRSCNHQRTINSSSTQPSAQCAQPPTHNYPLLHTTKECFE
jgi:hypothetical protein